MRIPKMAALGVAAAVVLAGCSGQASTQSNDTTDHLKIGNFLDVTSWDPALADIGFDGPYMSAIYDPLVALTKNGKPTPALAKSWKWSDHKKTLTMKLRGGVKFSDGEKFDADSAVKSLEHLKDGARSKEAYLNVKGFKTVSDKTVEIDMKKRDDTLLYLMGLGRSYMMAPKSIEKDSLKKKPVGSGPYTLDNKKSTSGSVYQFHKVSDHWDSKTYPFKKLTIRPITDENGRKNALKSGQLNLAYGSSDPQDAKDNGWTVSKRPLQWVGLEINDHTGNRVKALGDVRVRRALNYAFDSAQIVKSIGNGAGVPTNQLFPADGKIYDKKLNDRYKYDMGKAKKLLAEAGYKNGFSLKMPMSPQYQQFQPVAKQTFKKLGIHVKWDDMQQADYQTKAGNYPIFIGVIAMDSNPVATMHRQLTQKQWYNPKTDYKKFPKVRKATQEVEDSSGGKQRAALKKLNKLLVDKAWWSLWDQADGMYYSTDGIKIKPVTGMMFPTLRYISKD